MAKYTLKQALAELKKKGKPTKKNLEGMARFGINTKKIFCTRIPEVRKLAKKIGNDHNLALKLWKTEYNESRILAGLIADPEKVTPKLMDSWTKDMNSWEVCDLVCSNLFDRTKLYDKKIFQYAKSKHEFVKRAAFVLMATSAVHDKKATDAKFKRYLPLIIKHAIDGRNFVKKAVNWALRQIGKRNKALHEAAIKTGEQILKSYPDNKAARWVANGALRELKDDKIKSRIKS